MLMKEVKTKTPFNDKSKDHIKSIMQVNQSGFSSYCKPSTVGVIYTRTHHSLLETKLIRRNVNLMTQPTQ